MPRSTDPTVSATAPLKRAVLWPLAPAAYVDRHADVGPQEVGLRHCGTVPDDDDAVQVGQGLEARDRVQQHRLALVGQHDDCQHSSSQRHTRQTSPNASVGK